MVHGWKRRWIGLFAAIAIVLVALLLFGSEWPRGGGYDATARTAYEAALVKAVNGDRQAQFETAERLRQGLGVARSPVRAAEWYRKAAARGHIDAMYAMGTLREKGEGLPRDEGRAADWYRLAASLGRHGGAEFALAQLFYHGRGVPADPAEALSWYTKAAEDGHPAAQHVLGTIYESGWNVEVDPIEAYKWFSLAIPNRQQAMAIDRKFDPASARDALVRKMTRHQIARGEQAVAKWKPARAPRPVSRDGLPLVASGNGSAPAETGKMSWPAVRLFSFEAQVGPGGASRLSLNLIAEFAEPSVAVSACGLAPRLRDVVFQELWTRPVPEQAEAPALQAAGDRLVPALNEVLGADTVRRVLLYPGDRPLGANDVLQTPFTAVEECTQAIGW